MYARGQTARVERREAEMASRRGESALYSSRCDRRGLVRRRRYIFTASNASRSTDHDRSTRCPTRQTLVFLSSLPRASSSAVCRN